MNHQLLPCSWNQRYSICEKEPMPRNNEVYGSSYVEYQLNKQVAEINSTL